MPEKIRSFSYQFNALNQVSGKCKRRWSQIKTRFLTQKRRQSKRETKRFDDILFQQPQLPSVYAKSDKAFLNGSQQLMPCGCIHLHLRSSQLGKYTSYWCTTKTRRLWLSILDMQICTNKKQFYMVHNGVPNDFTIPKYHSRRNGTRLSPSCNH